MSSRSSNDAIREKAAAGSAEPERAAVRPAGGDRTLRVHSRELLRDGQLVIEHAGREYRLRVTSNGKLILTA